jgi:hypothetical protein
MILAKEGSDWVARSVSALEGTAVIRFRGTGGRSQGSPAIAGTATGFQIDTGFDLDRPHGLRVFIDGTASIEGATSVGFYTFGKMTGTFRFVSDNGQTGDCTVVAWSIQPVG